jgi:hypothetical protein
MAPREQRAADPTVRDAAARLTTLALGASTEDSAATTIGGDETNDAATDAGAVYVF